MTSHERSQSGLPLIDAKEVAALASVGPSAVSNWKRRHPDFPDEVERGLYDHDQVITWLDRHGKAPRLDADALTTERFDRTVIERQLGRWPLPADDAMELLVQLATIRAASLGQLARLEPLRGWWSLLTELSEPSPGLRLVELVKELGATDTELARALTPSSMAQQAELPWRDMLVGLGFLSEETDWGSISSDLLATHGGRPRSSGLERSTGGRLTKLILAILEPIAGTVYDPAAGTASVLATAWRRSDGSGVQLRGQEIDLRAWRLGFLRLVLEGADFELKLGDTLHDDVMWQLRADRIAIDPPIASAFEASPRMDSDPRWTWGVPMKSRADLLWVQHAAHHLADDGVAVVVVSPSTLSQAGAEADIRAKLITSDLLDVVIDLPPGTLARTAVAVTLVVLSHQRTARAGQVLFVDARRDGAIGPGGLRHLGSDGIARIAETIDAWRSGTWTAEDGFSASTPTGTLLEHRSVLAPSRWVSYSRVPREIDGEPIVERYQRLSEMALTRLEGASSLSRSFAETLRGIEVTDV